MQTPHATAKIEMKTPTGFYWKVKDLMTTSSTPDLKLAIECLQQELIDRAPRSNAIAFPTSRLNLHVVHYLEEGHLHSDMEKLHNFIIDKWIPRTSLPVEALSVLNPKDIDWSPYYKGIHFDFCEYTNLTFPPDFDADRLGEEVAFIRGKDLQRIVDKSVYSPMRD